MAGCHHVEADERHDREQQDSQSANGVQGLRGVPDLDALVARRGPEQDDRAEDGREQQELLPERVECPLVEVDRGHHVRRVPLHDCVLDRGVAVAVNSPTAFRGQQQRDDQQRPQAGQSDDEEQRPGAGAHPASAEPLPCSPPGSGSRRGRALPPGSSGCRVLPSARSTINGTTAAPTASWESATSGAPNATKTMVRISPCTLSTTAWASGDSVRRTTRPLAATSSSETASSTVTANPT